MRIKPNLIEFTIPILKVVREEIQILNTETETFIDLDNNIHVVFEDQYILTLEINAIRRWENILSLRPTDDSTLDDRRHAILAKILDSLPYTYRVLEQKLTALCGKGNFFIDLRPHEYYLKVIVELPSMNQVNDIGILLKKMIPANMTWIVEVDYNKHYQLKPYTHAQLNAKTHKSIREDVLR